MHITILKDRGRTVKTLRRIESEFTRPTQATFFARPSFWLSLSLYYQTLANLLEAGFSGIFLTADFPVLGRRLNEYRNSFKLPPGVSFPNLEFGEDNAAAGDSKLLFGSPALKGFKSVIRTDREKKQD